MYAYLMEMLCETCLLLRGACAARFVLKREKYFCF